MIFGLCECCGVVASMEFGSRVQQGDGERFLTECVTHEVEAGRPAAHLVSVSAPPDVPGSETADRLFNLCLKGYRAASSG